MKPFTLSGSLVALPTPFRDGRLDLDSFRTLVEEHIAAQTSGLVVCGTTGEGCTLSDSEQKTMLASAVRFAAGRIPIVAGVGSNRTDQTVELSAFAEQCGVEALLVVTPYYNRPNRSGLHRHFETIGSAVETPVILYNVPSRTGLDLEPRLVRELVERHANIVGIKEVTDSVQRVRELLAIRGLAVFCGEDSALSVFAREGARGAIGVLANLAPNEVAELLRVSRSDPARGEELEFALANSLEALYLETNPVPLKAALALRGRMSAEVRSPLGPLAGESRRRLEQLLGETSPARKSALADH